MPNAGRRPASWVLDTNVVIAGLLWQGPPRWILEQGFTGSIAFSSSAVLLDELAHTLEHAKFAGRIARFGTRADVLVARYAAMVSTVRPITVPRVVRNDADDDHVLAAAVAAGAELIVTGDRKHLLPLGSHAGIPIVTAREALARVGQAQ